MPGTAVSQRKRSWAKLESKYRQGHKKRRTVQEQIAHERRQASLEQMRKKKSK